jgi:hypothetical protein
MGWSLGVLGSMLVKVDDINHEPPLKRKRRPGAGVRRDVLPKEAPWPENLAEG